MNESKRYGVKRIDILAMYLTNHVTMDVDILAIKCLNVSPNAFKFYDDKSHESYQGPYYLRNTQTTLTVTG